MGKLYDVASSFYQKGLNRISLFRRLRFEYTYNSNNGWASPETQKKCAEEFIKYIPMKKYKSALDLGCGYGWESYELAKFITKVVGIDISPTALHRAQKDVKNVRFVQSDIVDFCEGMYDLILCVSSLNYVPKKYAMKIAQNIDMMLSNNGILVIIDAVLREEEISADTDTIEYLRHFKYYPYERKFVYLPSLKRHFSFLIVHKKNPCTGIRGIL